MDWRGRILNSDTLADAAVDWVSKMRQGAPPEIGIILIVANCRDGQTSVVAGTPNLSRDAKKALLKNARRELVTDD